MHEIEVKILDINREYVEAKLISLGAVKVFDDDIYSLYYDLADNSIRGKLDALRLRKEGPKAVLTYKRHINNELAKERDEFEATVSDFDSVRVILESLGLKVWLEMRKHRRSYKFLDAHIEIDKYSGLHSFIPEFLEIEAPDIEAIYNIAGLLGFNKDDCRAWDSVQLAEHYSAKVFTLKRF